MNEYVHRDISLCLQDAATQYPIVTLTGPRQSGKSTLLRHLYSDYKYVNLEEPDLRELAEKDARAFLRNFPGKTIIDEAQRVPSLFSYLQAHVDEVDQPGMYFLAGSHNFLLMEAINQSLAGRTAVLHLLPFSRAELHEAGKLPENVSEQIFKGFYPRLYDRNINPSRYYADYLRTYVERDVRQITRIVDLNKFTLFLKLCAARIGQLLNLNSLANECGINIKTAESWLSILEASFIVYRLLPSHVNYNKRLVKASKLYFFDTGLASHLLSLKNASEIDLSYLKGALFENLVINQFVKNSYNKGENPDIYFWRDSQGTEVDLLLKSGSDLFAYEIKSGQTFNSDYFKNLVKWCQISNVPPEECNIIYLGNQGLTTSNGNLIPFGSFYKAEK